MSLAFAKIAPRTPLAEKSLKKRIIVTLAATGTVLALTATGAKADRIERDFPGNKTSLVALYHQWKTEQPNQTLSDKKVKITPASAKAVKSSKNSAKKVTNDEISDADIFSDAEDEVNDPLEPLNRVVFQLNEVLDFIIFTPVSRTYRFIVPDPVRTGVSNAIANAKAPVTLVNDLLQGKPDRAKTTFMRFLINTTAGLGGFVDAAEAGGFEKHTEDFGQTLAVWGVGSGPYLVAPVFGPITPRHIVGRVADTAATPTTWALSGFSLLKRSTPTMADLVTSHEALLDDITSQRETSPDFYASVRGIYLQSRKNAIFDGDLGVDPIPDLPLE